MQWIWGCPEELGAGDCNINSFVYAEPNAGCQLIVNCHGCEGYYTDGVAFFICTGLYLVCKHPV